MSIGPYLTGTASDIPLRTVDPIALGVRSTNVYEERSLGIYHDEEAEPDVYGSKAGSGGRYLSWHMRRQLAFGQSPACQQAGTDMKATHLP